MMVLDLSTLMPIPSNCYHYHTISVHEFCSSGQHFTVSDGDDEFSGSMEYERGGFGMKMKRRKALGEPCEKM